MAMNSPAHHAPMELTEKHRQRYLAWYETHSTEIGRFQSAELLSALSSSHIEAIQSGIDTPNRFFLYATARLLMPDMKAPRYSVVMDIIFSKCSDLEKIRKILELSHNKEEEILLEFMPNFTATT